MDGFAPRDRAGTAVKMLTGKEWSPTRFSRENPYRQRGLKIIRVSINFDTQARKVGEWKSETAWIPG